MRFIVVIVLGLLNLQACSLVDDYVLGKDNTLKPAPLKKIHPKVHLVKQWSAAIGKSVKTRTYLKLKPVKVGQVIYTAMPDGRISAVDAHTGHLIWNVVLKQSIVSGPTVSQGVVIVSTDSATLVALSQVTGEKRWVAHLSEDALSKSVIESDKVIAKSIDGHLYAFDLKRGKERWMVEHGAPNLILRTSSAPKVMGDLVVVGYSDGKLDAIELSTGRMVWQRSIAYANGASDVERLVDIGADLVIRGRWVYLASYQGYIGALNLDDGQFIWSKPASVYKNMAIDSETLYVSDSHDVIWAYDLQTGQIKWKQTALKGHVITEPVLNDKYLVVGDSLGYVHTLSKKNGERIGLDFLGSAIDISPLQSEGQFLFVTADGVLSALSLQAVS